MSHGARFDDKQNMSCHEVRKCSNQRKAGERVTSDHKEIIHESNNPGYGDTKTETMREQPKNASDNPHSAMNDLIF